MYRRPADEFTKALRRIGLMPRMFATWWTVVGVPGGLIGAVNGLGPITAGGLVVVPLTLLVLSLRVRASVTADAFVVRSYLKTYVLKFDYLHRVVDVPYSGGWNGAASDLFIHMFQTNGRNHQHSVVLRATMCGKKTARVLAEGLNERIQHAADAKRAAAE